MADTQTYICMDCKGGNPVSAPGVGAYMPLVTRDLGATPNQLSVALTLKWSSSHVRSAISLKKNIDITKYSGFMVGF